MHNRFDKRPLAEYKNAVLDILLDDYADLDVAQVLQEFEEKAEAGDLPDVPEDIDQKCRRQISKAFARQRRTQHLRKTPKILVKAAIFILMLIGLSTVTVLSVEALRIPVLQFVVETFDRHSTIHIEGEAAEPRHIAEEICRILDENVPVDYKLVQRSIADDGFVRVMYRNIAGQLLSLTVFVSQEMIQIDTEDAIHKTMMLNDHQAIFIDKNGYRIVWLDERYEILFDLKATSLDEDVFWKIVYALAK